MKLTYFLVLLMLMQVSVNVRAQTIKFNVRAENKPIVEILQEIEESSKYRFFYIREQVNVEAHISIKVNNTSIEEILKELFKDQGVKFQIMEDFLILLSPGHIQYEKATLGDFQHSLSGFVSNESGLPLAGVSVRLNGTNKGTITNANGRYYFTIVPKDALLIFSFIGKKQKKISVEDKTKIDVILFNDAIKIEEVVTIGYGTQRKSDITGSVGIINSNVILEMPAFNALQGMKGKIAGVNIFSNSGSPSGSTRVIIRGINSIETTSDPLYVVDGVAMENFNLMNPNDIERIEVLKDASSAAIYGARGANGVILVTTKRGAQQGEVIISYDGFLSVGRIRKKMDLLNSAEWLEVIKKGYQNAPKYKNYSADEIPTIDFTDPNIFDANGNPLYDTDWQDESTRTSISHNHQLNIRQGNEKSSVGAFLNYTNIQGVMLNSWLKRVNAKITYDAKPVEWMDFGINMLINKTWENEIEESAGYQMPRRTMIEFVPILPVKFPDGSWSNSSSTSNFALEGMANPVHVLTTQDRLRNRTQFFGNTFFNFHILPGLDLKSQFGIDYHIDENKDYSPTDLLNISFPNAFASINNYESMYWQEETFLNYNYSNDDHRINSLLGISWQERTFNFNLISATGYSDDFLKYNNMGAASDPDAPSSGYERWAMNSYFFRFGYSYKRKYLATITGRADGSSRFGENNKYGFFPSIGVGWILSNEDFLVETSFLDYLKLRASYGITGSTELGTYRSLATITSGTVLLNGERANYSQVSKLPNPELSWEKTSQFDIGINATLFDQKVSVEVDYYYKLTSDLILNRPVPHSSGFTSVLDNIGSVSNQGIDFLLTTHNFQNAYFQWTTTTNLNFNKNRIEKLGQNDEDIFPGPWWVSGSQTILRVGEPLGSFWGYRRLGTWGTEELIEAAAVGAVPGVAKRSAEKEILGNGLPVVTGSLTNRLNYNNFDFIFDLQFSFGAQIMQQFFHSTEDRTGYANGLSSILYDGWTETNQNTMVQQIRNAPLNGQNTEIDDHWLTNGSYLRGNLISIGYTLKNSTIFNVELHSCRFYANINNAFVINSKDFKGYDPEATSWSGNQWGQNIFFFQYPKPTTVTLGMNLKF